MENFVAVDDSGNQVPLQVVRSGDNLVIFLNEGQTIEGVTEALQGVADGGQGQYQIMVTENYTDGQQFQNIQQVEGYDQQIQDVQAAQEGQSVFDVQQAQEYNAEGFQDIQHVTETQLLPDIQPVPEYQQVTEAEPFPETQSIQEGQPILEGQHVQENQPFQEHEPVQDGQPTQEGQLAQEGQPIQEDHEIPKSESLEGAQPVQEAQPDHVTPIAADTTEAFIPVFASGSESEGVNAFVSAVASGFQDPSSASHSIGDLPGVNIPIDSNFSLPVSQFVQNNLAAVASSAGTGEMTEKPLEIDLSGNKFEVKPSTVESGTNIEDLIAESLTKTAVTTQTAKPFIATRAMIPNTIGDIISEPLSTSETQVEKPFLATKVEIPKAVSAQKNVITAVVSQKPVIQSNVNVPSVLKSAGSRSEAVSILLKCEKCDQVFFTASELKAHREKMHPTAQITMKDKDLGNISSVVVDKKPYTGTEMKKTVLSPTYTSLLSNSNYQKTATKSVGIDTNKNLCTVCHIICPSIQALIKHKHDKHGIDMPFKCELCNYSASQKRYVDTHMKLHSKIFKCKICQNAFESEEKLDKHLTQHAKDKYQCFYCSKMYLTRKACTDHIALKHSTSQQKEVKKTEQAQPPPKTKENIPQGESVDSLVESTDQSENNLTAQVNDENVSTTGKEAEIDAPAYTEEQKMAVDTISEDNLMEVDEELDDEVTDKEQNDGELKVDQSPKTDLDPQKPPDGLEDFTPIKNKDFQCLVCYAEFTTEILFQNHYLKEHTEENMCLACGKSFMKRFLLRCHFQETHCCRDVYKCKNCDRVFNMVQKYWRHAQIHARRYVCSKCDKAFSIPFELKRHEMSVHEAKTYFCVYCPESFTTAGDLRKHKSEAHNVKSYVKSVPKEDTAVKPEIGEDVKPPKPEGVTTAKSLIQQAKESGSQMTIKIFGDGTYMTTDPNTGNTDYGTIDLSNLGLDPALLQSHNDLELVIIPPDKEEEHSDLTKQNDAETTKTVTVGTGKSSPKLKQSNKALKTMEGSGSSVQNGERSHSCRFCPRTFRFFRHLRCHENAHNRSEKYECHICKRMFVRETNLKLHLDLHTKKEIKPLPIKKPPKKSPIIKVEQKCDTCGKIFKDSNKLSRHIKEVHEKVAIECQICKRSFKSESNVQRHMKTHYGPFACTYCSEIFKVKEELNSHVNEFHQRKLHTCQICGTHLFSFGKLLCHMKKIHPEDKAAVKEVTKILRCDICQKQFTSAKSVRVHKMIHTGEKKYQCPHCPWKFYVAWKLKRHMQHAHVNAAKNNRFPCEMCMKEFHKKEHLQKHEREAHPGPYRCQLCKAKKFNDKEKLKQHCDEKHSGNSVKCSLCELPFSCGRHLEIHQFQSHSQTFLCDLCGYAFTRKDEMHEHLKFNHFGGDEEKLTAAYPNVDKSLQQTDFEELRKTLCCTRCGKKFKKYNGLMSHMRSCEKDTDDNLEGGPVSPSVDKSSIDYGKLRTDPTCKTCGKTFMNLAAVVSHMRHCTTKFIQSSTKLKGEAEKLSKTVKSVKKERKETDENDISEDEYVPFSYLKTDKYHTCDQCQKTFSKRTALRQHLLVHAGIKKVNKVKNKKEKVEKQFENISKEESSADISNERSTSSYYDMKNCKCNICNCTLTTPFSLKRHMHKMHPEASLHMDTKHSSATVKKELKNESNTEEEMSQLAKNQFLEINFSLGIKTEPSSDLTSPVVETVKTKRHYCKLCGLKFSREATLNKHLSEVHDKEESVVESDSSDSMEREVNTTQIKTRDKSKFEGQKIGTKREDKGLARKTDKGKTKKDLSKIKIKTDNEKVKPVPDKSRISKTVQKGSTEILKPEKMSLRNLSERKVQCFKCKYCDSNYDSKLALARHMKYNHKELKQLASTLTSVKNLRGRNMFYNFRAKKKLTTFQKPKTRKRQHKSTWSKTKQNLSKSDKGNDNNLPKAVKTKELRKRKDSVTGKPEVTKKQTKNINKKLSTFPVPIKLVTDKKLKQTHKIQRPTFKTEQVKKQSKNLGSSKKKIKTQSSKTVKKTRVSSSTTILGGLFSHFLKQRIKLINFECEFCDRQFSEKLKLKFHIRKKHASQINSKSICTCNVCGKVFHEMRPFLLHMGSIHYGRHLQADTKQCNGDQTDTSFNRYLLKGNTTSGYGTGEEGKFEEIKVLKLEASDNESDFVMEKLGDENCSDLGGHIADKNKDAELKEEQFSFNGKAYESNESSLPMADYIATETDILVQENSQIETKRTERLDEEQQCAEIGLSHNVANGFVGEPMLFKEEVNDDGTTNVIKETLTKHPAEGNTALQQNVEFKMETDNLSDVEDKLLGEDTEVEEPLSKDLDYPVVHDVDMFTGNLVSNNVNSELAEITTDNKNVSKGKIIDISTERSAKQCQICVKKFFTETGYNKHLITHTNKNYVCSECDAAFRWKKNYESHWQLFHSDCNALVCRACNKIFYDKSAFVRHQITHQVRKFSCSFCKKKFCKYTLLKSHVNEVHKNLQLEAEKPCTIEMVCTVCNIKCSKMEHLLNHMLILHSARKPARLLFKERMYKYKCRYCPLFFKTAESLKSHVKVCDKRTVLAKKLLGLELTDNTCSVCGIKFKNKTSTYKHLQESHGNGSKFQHIDFLKTSTVQKRYSCKNCHGVFAKFSSYIMHEKSLYGICMKKKKSPKYEQCPFCKVFFGSRLILGKHMLKAHNNNLFYSWKHCPYCKQAFARRMNLKKHLQNVHPKKLNEERKVVKKKHIAAVALEQQVMKTVDSQQPQVSNKEHDHVESKYKKVRQSAGIERHKCEFCGRVHWTLDSFEEHLSKYHPDRWIEKSVNSPSLSNSPASDHNEVVESTSDDSKLAAFPVVLVQRLPVDLLLKSSESYVVEEKESTDRYLGVPYHFNAANTTEGADNNGDTVQEMKEISALTDTDVVNLPELPLEQPEACETHIQSNTEGSGLGKGQVESDIIGLFPNSRKVSSAPVELTESLPDEILDVTGTKISTSSLVYEPAVGDVRIPCESSLPLSVNQSDNQLSAGEGDKRHELNKQSPHGSETHSDKICMQTGPILSNIHETGVKETEEKQEHSSYLADSETLNCNTSSDQENMIEHGGNENAEQYENLVADDDEDQKELILQSGSEITTVQAGNEDMSSEKTGADINQACHTGDVCSGKMEMKYETGYMEAVQDEFELQTSQIECERTVRVGTEETVGLTEDTVTTEECDDIQVDNYEKDESEIDNIGESQTVDNKSD